MLEPKSYAMGRWVGPGQDAAQLKSPVTGQVIARAGCAALDFAAMRDWAKNAGGPALRAMTFHQRARMLKALAGYLDSRKEELYALNPLTGATRKDGWIDIDGGIGTLFVFASKGRREMPDGQVYLDGGIEQLSRRGSFLGQHVATPLQGVAVHINAFNFPVWGMLEKLAPTLLAGVPAIVKPATQTSFLTEACVRILLDSGLLPAGALQLIVGGTGDLLDILGPQDVVSFTGSAATALSLRAKPNMLSESVRFVAEQDSLNAAILGPDATPGTPEFDLFVKEAVTEMTTKAGQKCTAIRRMIVPASLIDPMLQALTARLEKTTVGNPESDGVKMGALVSAAQRDDVLRQAEKIGTEARRVFGDPDFTPQGAAPATVFCRRCCFTAPNPTPPTMSMKPKPSARFQP